MKKYYWAYRNKITCKLFGVAKIPAKGKSKGAVLLSYITSPFTSSLGSPHTDPHTSYWECAEIARLFSEKGYDVDVIDWNNTKYIPRKAYAVCIDTHKNLERLSKYLSKNCIKVMHVVSAYSNFQTEAEKKRLDSLEIRRGVRLIARRTEESTENPKFADYMEGFGNKRVHQTYERFRKNIFPIKESVSKIFDFPQDKDFARARNKFLWFGGGGAIHKGLDMIVEAFSQMPELHLHIIGPILSEKDFLEEYKSELALPNITLHGRPRIDALGKMTVDGEPFEKIANECAALVYMSCSEGTSGAVIQGMHVGMIPIITPESGIMESAPQILVETPTPEKIKEIVKEFANLPSEKIKKMALDSWSFARTNYSKEAFSKGYKEFIEKVLHL
jgi:hypothetical protein